MNRLLSYAWAGMFVICAALGFIDEASGIVKVALVVLSILFFLPAGLLLYNGFQEKNRTLIRRIRWISLSSLLLTFIGLVLNILFGLLYAAGAVSAQLATVTSVILVVVSAPMFCGRYLFISLFLWACLFFTTFFKLTEKK